MRSRLLWFVLFLTPLAARAEEINREPAAAKHSKKHKKPAPVRKRSQTGADREEGWIIRHTDKGTVKVRRNQTFVFEGSDVTGAPNRPSQTVLGQRPNYENRTLIPERGSFRKEFYEAAGYASGGRSQ